MSSSLRTMGKRPSVTDWGSGMSASCNRGSNCSQTRAMDGCNSALRYIISSCQSAATSEIVKGFWSRTHVRNAITSIVTFITAFSVCLVCLYRDKCYVLISHLSAVLCFSLAFDGTIIINMQPS